MFSLIRRSNFWIMVCADAVLSAAAYFLAYLIRFDGSVPAGVLHNFARTVVWLVLVKLAFLFCFRLYKGIGRYTGVHDLLNLIKALSASSGFNFCAILGLYGFVGFSRGVFVIDFLLAVIFIGGLRLCIRLVASYARGRKLGDEGRSQPAPLRRLVIIGAGNTGEKLVREIKENRRLNYDVVGFVDDDASKLRMTIHGVPVLGCLSNLAVIVRDFEVDEIVITASSASAAEMRRIISFCKGTNLPFKTVPGIGELVEGKVITSAIREVRYEDLLGRQQVEIDVDSIGQFLTGKRVMVTGAAGSIGSELCRQIARFNPSLLVLVDRGESGLYDIEMEFRNSYPHLNVMPILCAIQNKALMQKFFDQHRAQVVFHAAAYKHVPMMELHPWEAVFNNVLGTQTLLEMCVRNKAEKCVIISSDKAVRPSNIMGATKRLTELLALSHAKQGSCKFMAVRFGNVIGSAGSVIPLFKKQIAQGGPVTVTHRDITRYFMTIPEASRLVLQAGAIGRGGEIFVLKMGTPVRIDSLARDMITLSGLRPDEDIRIEYTGLRPGEKLYEELIASGEDILPTRHDKIMVLSSRDGVSGNNLNRGISDLLELAVNGSASGIKQQLARMISEYRPYVVDEPKVATIPAVAGEETVRPIYGRANKSANTARILVVDDEKAVADMLVEYLRASGYATSAVYSAQEGLGALEKGQHNLVIADLMLSDMKGTQMLEAIKKLNKKIDVIIMTGYATIESNVEAIQKGAQHFVSKPFKFTELENIIQMTLKRRQAA